MTEEDQRLGELAARWFNATQELGARLDESGQYVEFLKTKLAMLAEMHQQTRSLLGRERCSHCGHPWPCPTVKVITGEIPCRRRKL